jgi:AcrR family transcriptional regulator
MSASTPRTQAVPADHPVRARILDAAFAAFMELGYAQTSTLEIATRAGVSKRDLYALVGTKQDMLMGGIEQRVRRMRAPPELPVPTDRASFADVLTALCVQLLRETTDATVIGVFRLAIGEAVRVPEVAQTLDRVGRGTVRAELTAIMTQARSLGLLRDRPADLVDQITGLLWSDLMLSLLLGVAQQPDSAELKRRARAAVTAFLQLHPPGGEARASRAGRVRGKRRALASKRKPAAE